MPRQRLARLTVYLVKKGLSKPDEVPQSVMGALVPHRARQEGARAHLFVERSRPVGRAPVCADLRVRPPTKVTNGEGLGE